MFQKKYLQTTKLVISIKLIDLTVDKFNTCTCDKKPLVAKTETSIN